MQRRISWLRVFLLVAFVVGLVVGGMALGGVFSNKDGLAQVPNGGLPATTVPGQVLQPTVAVNVDPNVNGGLPVVPGVQSADGYYPGQCRPGDVRPPLNVAFDDYAGFYPVIVQYMTISNDHYCLNLMPKWSGPDWAINGWTEDVVEEKMKNHEIDVYFGSNGALATWDSNSGVVVYSTDQSAGADAIIMRNSIATHFDADGKPLPNFNDAFGQIACTTRGSADHYFLLKALQAVGFQNSDVRIIYPDYPVDSFVAGECNIVAYWDPIVRAAMLPDTTTIITTNRWRTVSDYVVIDRLADVNKKDAILYFLADFNISTDALTNENLANTANLLASWVHDGNNMAGWLFLDTNPVEDLVKLMAGVAPATLNNNVNMFEKDGSGWSLVKDQFDKTHNTFQIAEIYDNKDNTKGSLFNSEIFISDEYVKILSKSGAKSVKGQFSNPYITDINESLPNVDNNKLFTLPEILSVKDKYIQFVQNQSRELVKDKDGKPVEMEKLLGLLQPIANLMSESPDSVIVIRGGAGFYSDDPAQMAQAQKFAFRRALYIRDIMSDPNGLNIPIDRILIDPNVLLPDHYPSTVINPATGRSELDEYVVVIIRVVNAGDIK